MLFDILRSWSEVCLLDFEQNADAPVIVPMSLLFSLLQCLHFALYSNHLITTLMSHNFYYLSCSFNCTTGAVGSIINMPIIVELAFQSDSIESGDTFQYLVPRLDGRVTPSLGPSSGGTLIRVSGTDLGSGSTRRVFIQDKECVVESFDQNNIFCRTPPNVPSIQNVVEVFIDSWNGQAFSFDYFEDPTFAAISPNISFFAYVCTYYETVVLARHS